MKILIDEIDSSKPKALGYTNMLSFPAHFRCDMFHGWARFVPAEENLDTYLNKEIEVEIAHESIDCLGANANGLHRVLPLTEAFSYHVCGAVKTIAHHSEPKGNRTTYVVVGDVAFPLSLEDIGNLRLSAGDTVEFVVHGLSLWDESI